MCCPHRFHKGKRPRALFTHKNWKFDKLLEEVKGFLAEYQEKKDDPVYVSAEWLSIRYRSKLKTMNSVISQLQRENILTSRINFIHDGCWSTTLYKVKRADSKRIE